MKHATHRKAVMKRVVSVFIAVLLLLLSLNGSAPVRAHDDSTVSDSVYVEDGGTVSINDLPYADDEWLDDDTMEIWDDAEWAYSDDESHMVFDFDGLEGLEDFELPYEIFFYDDLPEICASYWLEDEWLESDIFYPYDLFMPFNATPSLTVSHSNLTSNSVTLHGTVNPNGVNINMRGFWIRSDNEVNAREVRATGASNSFSSAVTGLRPNTVYHVRSIARRPGQVSAAYQSPPITIRTPQAQPTINVPSMPLGLRVTPGVGQVTLHWSPPSNNGGAAIQRYEVALNNGAWMPAQSMSSHTFSVSGNGQQTFRVRAVNSAGAGTQASIQGMPLPPNTQTPPPQTPPPANHPSLTLSIRNITSSTATLVGTVTPNGANITMRGFWFRRDNQATHQEVIVNTSSNTFEITITDLTPNTNFYVRAVARASGITGTHQSPAGHFRTQAPPSGPPVTVTFNANGGIGGTTREVRVGNIVGALPPSPSRANHTFGGWFTSQTGGTQVTANTIVHGAITYWARWNTTITFNTHGGNALSPITEPSGTTRLLPTPTRTGHAFLGWDGTPQGISSLDESIFAENLYASDFEEDIPENRAWEVESLEYQSIEAANTNLITGMFTFNGHRTLHAHWVRAHTVTFNANGGVLSADQSRRQVEVNAAVGTLPIPTRAGHVFIGWYSTLTGRDTEVDHREIIRNDRTFYARWRITVTFNPNGGIMPPGGATMQITSGYPLVIPPQPIRAGRTFGQRLTGWFVPDSGLMQAGQTVFAPNSNVTINAWWESNTDSTRHLDIWWQRSTAIPLSHFEIDNVPVWYHADRNEVDFTLEDDDHVSMTAAEIINWGTGIGVGVNGVSSWNVSRAPVSFYLSNDTNNLVIVHPVMNRTWYGLHRGWPTVEGGSELNRITIILNMRTINDHAEINGFTLQNVITSVMVHELGHTLGLADNPNRGEPNSSIMNTNRNRNDQRRPTQYDVESVEMIYD